MGDTVGARSIIVTYADNNLPQAGARERLQVRARACCVVVVVLWLLAVCLACAA